MVQGLKIVIPSAFSNNALPRLPEVDALESSGSLLLTEPGHPANPFVGVPAGGAVLPNLLAAKAAGMIPSGTSTTLASTVDLGSTMLTGGRGALERTSKGGLHLALSQTVTSWDTNTYLQLGIPALIGQYLAANPTRTYFFSLWHRYTRLPGSGFAGPYTVLQQPAAANPVAFFGRPSGSADTEYPNTAARLGYRRTGNSVPIALGPLLQNIGVQKSDAYTSGAGFAWRQGTKADTATADYGKHPSDIFYRLYIEDLTTSGRSYATVDALDYAEWQAAFATGGRYASDTFTDPATLAA